MDASTYMTTSGAELASVNRRFMGEVIDGFVTLAIGAISIEKGFSSDAYGILIVLAGTFIAFLFPAVVATVTNGRTPGKLFVGTRAVRIDGERFNLGFAVRREFLLKRIRWVGGMGMREWADWTTLTNDRQRQSGHDKEAGTLVVMA